MGLTVEQLEREAAALTAADRRRLLDRLVAMQQSAEGRRISLRGALTGSGITDADLEEAKHQWR